MGNPHGIDELALPALPSGHQDRTRGEHKSCDYDDTQDPANTRTGLTQLDQVDRVDREQNPEQPEAKKHGLCHEK